MKLRAGVDQEVTARVIAWLQQCFDMMQEGKPLQPDPFYERGKLFEPAQVKATLVALEDIFKSELTRYPGYHRTAQGISESEYLVPPGFDKLDATQSLAVVQGIDRILQDYRDDSTPLSHPEGDVC